MTENIELQKLKEVYPEFFKKTPPEIIEFILSEETASKITNICAKNGIGDEDKVSEIACRITFVLLGKLPKENLVIALEKGVGLAPEIAKKISAEVNGVILPGIPKIQPPAEPKESAQRPMQPPVQPREGKPQEPKKNRGEDTYREPVE